MIRSGAFFFLLLSCVACGTENRFDVELSGVDRPDLKVQRMDRAVFEVNTDTADMAAHHIGLLNEYGDFYRLYYRKMLGEGSPAAPMAQVHLKGFIEDVNMTDVYEGVQKVYPNLDKEEERFEKAFQYYRYHFPDSSIPKELIAYQGGFSYAIYPTDSSIGIGLEWFLGSDHRVTKRLPTSQFPQYKKDKMEPKYLVSEALKGWLKFKRRGRARELETLLQHMIFEGKLLYSMDAVMPNTPDSIKVKYSEQEIRWVRKNELRIWKTMVDKEVFFKKKTKLIRKLMKPAPFTHILPRESPGRVGQWLGWQMVRSYMKEHPNMPLERLLKIEDARRIFKSYKPEKAY
ncbi:MAG: hypothetical protein ABEH38_04155 [Flavobacteriales bacterium]